VALRNEVKSRMPRVDLPEILLEIAARTGCLEAFTHLTERTARANDLATSLCAVSPRPATPAPSRLCGRTLRRCGATGCSG
jgi:hypothetical protein